MTCAGTKASPSSTCRTGLRAPTSNSPASTPVSTTMPVTMREPTGTRTRAPTAGGTAAPAIEYVRRSSAGTGTATRINTILTSAFGQEPLDQLHVFPDLALRGRVAQKIRRVERRHELRAAIVEDAPAQPRDWLVGPKQRLRT